jgi:hypothetical protein
MGFMDSIKDALGGDRDDGTDAASESVATPPAPPPVEPKHVDPDAAAENTYGIEATGGKHAARD